MITLGGYQYRYANASDNELVKRILRQNDMDAWVRLSFEREPDYFEGTRLTGDTVTVLAERVGEPGHAVGMYYCSCMPVFINGKPEQVNYLGGLRVNTSFRNKVSVLKHGYQSVCQMVKQKGSIPFYFTSIASDNQLARRVLERNLPGMPVYHPVGELLSLVLGTRQTLQSSILTQATKADIPALVEFYHQQVSSYQFAPVLSADWLASLPESSGLSIDNFWLVKDQQGIQACVAIWDQRHIKQTVVRGYRFPLGLLRRPINLLSKLRKQPRLPALNESLKQSYLSFLAIDARGLGKARDIIANALLIARKQGADSCVTGLSVDNPLSRLIRQHFNTYIYRTLIETVRFGEDDGFSLNNAFVQPEIALL